MTAKDEARLLSHIEQDEATGCWNWTSCLDGCGYGKITWQGRQLGAHRVAYTVWRGPIQDGLTLDHLCRNRACVNPAHLEPVTIGVNTLRSPYTVSSINAAKTHCPRGHEFTPENLVPWRPGRHCLTCTRKQVRESQRRHRARKTAEVAA